MKEPSMKHPLTLLLVSALFLPFARVSVAQQWIQLAPTGGPPTARDGASAIFDDATNQMIIFAGVHTNSSPPPPGVLLSDTWSLTVSGAPQWRQLNPSGSLPQARQGHTAVYDSATSRMIIFGGAFGFTYPCANDTWVLSNANSVAGTPAWTQLFPTGGLPPARNDHTAVYDPGSNRMVVFGGLNCLDSVSSDWFNDVWVLTNANGLGGTPAWIQLAPTGGPPSARFA